MANSYETAMQRIHIIAVGHLREPHWRTAAGAYAARLRRSFLLEESAVKDGNAALAAPERSRIEGERILKALRPVDYAVSLDEQGETMNSEAFARFIRRTLDRARVPCFIVGGAYGLSRDVLGRSAKSLSFGPMTFPHELARVMLLEQIYRADMILRGSPYHHG